jgi:hypothetical protein
VDSEAILVTMVGPMCDWPARTEVGAMTPQSSSADVVDRARLARMGKEVGEQALRTYVSLFHELLDSRIERIDRVVVGQTADGLWAALDLQIGSEMLGAKRLAAIAADVVILLRSGEPISHKRMETLRAEAATADAALQQALTALSRPGPGVQPSSDPPPKR